MDSMLTSKPNLEPRFDDARDECQNQSQEPAQGTNVKTRDADDGAEEGAKSKPDGGDGGILRKPGANYARGTRAHAERSEAQEKKGGRVGRGE